MEEKKKEEEKIEESKKGGWKGILIFGGIIVAFVLGIIWIMNSANNFDYQGLSGNVVKEGDILFYQMSFPVIYQGEKRDYNVYLRNDPRKLDEISFDGEIKLLKNVVVNDSGNLRCGGYGILAITNLAQVYQALGADVIADKNASCDPEGRYAYINLKEGNETRITEISPACYQIEVANCEVLQATEKFIVETILKVNKIADEK